MSEDSYQRRLKLDRLAKELSDDYERNQSECAHRWVTTMTPSCAEIRCHDCNLAGGSIYIRDGQSIQDAEEAFADLCYSAIERFGGERFKP